MLKKTNPKRGRNIVILVFVVVLLVVLTAFFGVKLYYLNRWNPRTTINEMDVSGKTYEETRQAMQDIADSYVLHVQGRKDGVLDINGADIQLHVDFEDKLNALFEQQKAASFFPNFSKETYEEEFPVEVSREQLKNVLQQAEMVKGSSNYEIVKPVSAYVTYSEEEGCGVLVEEEMGNKIQLAQLEQAVMDSIERMDTTLDLTDESQYHDVYRNPKFTSEDEQLQEQIKTYNNYLLNWVTWKMGEGVEETITPEDIKDWLHVNKAGKVKFDKQGLRDWVEQFCLKYKTYGATRDFTTHDGEKIQVSGGDYGWRMDFEATVKQANRAIQKDKSEAIDAYIASGTDADCQALTTTYKPKYVKTAFRMNFENPTQDWDTENYSEIDISDQMVYVYKDGKLAYSSICVTGLASDPERATKLGCYDIKDKKEDYVLTGEDYETPTKYWVRIMWTGTGYHYLGRSDWGNWSPEIYKTRGSHGCINLQLEDAKNIYDLVQMHDVVFIHE